MEKPLNEYITEYSKQLEIGDINQAYKGLMEYIKSLRNHFIKNYPKNFVAGSIYQGYMDYTFFTFTPKLLRNKKLKIVIIFEHKTMTFEVWLSGQNKEIRRKYKEFFRNNGFKKYTIFSATEDNLSIIEHSLIKNPNFDNLDYITEQIEEKTMIFINKILDFIER